MGHGQVDAVHPDRDSCGETREKDVGVLAAWKDMVSASLDGQSAIVVLSVGRNPVREVCSIKHTGSRGYVCRDATSRADRRRFRSEGDSQ